MLHNVYISGCEINTGNSWVRAMFCVVLKYSLGRSAPSYIFHNQHKTLNNLYINNPIPITFYWHQVLVGIFPAILGKGPWPKLENMIDFTSKLGEINVIEHKHDNKGSKIYLQNQVILDCIMPSIPLKHKCLSIILIWVILFHK